MTVSKQAIIVDKNKSIINENVFIYRYIYIYIYIYIYVEKLITTIQEEGMIY